MSPQESRILWCLVEGNPIPYYVHDIPIGAKCHSIEGIDNTVNQMSQRHNKILPSAAWNVVSLIPRVCAF